MICIDLKASLEIKHPPIIILTPLTFALIAPPIWISNISMAVSNRHGMGLGPATFLVFPSTTAGTRTIAAHFGTTSSVGFGERFSHGRLRTARAHGL